MTIARRVFVIRTAAVLLGLVTALVLCPARAYAQLPCCCATEQHPPCSCEPSKREQLLTEKLEASLQKRVDLEVLLAKSNTAPWNKYLYAFGALGAAWFLKSVIEAIYAGRVESQKVTNQAFNELQLKRDKVALLRELVTKQGSFSNAAVEKILKAIEDPPPEGQG